jgi:hypothetical protein
MNIPFGHGGIQYGADTENKVWKIGAAAHKLLKEAQSFVVALMHEFKKPQAALEVQAKTSHTNIQVRGVEIGNNSGCLDSG